MKAKILLLFLLSWAGVILGQIQSKVFVLDLKQPHSNSLKVEGSDLENQLVINTKELLAFKLINGNPYKYKYVINHQFINFFEGQNENPLQLINKNIGAVKADSLKSFNKIELLAIKKNELLEKEKSFMLLKEKKTKKEEEILFFDKIKLEGEIFDLKKDIIKLKDIVNLNEYPSESQFSTNFINHHNSTKLPTAKNKEEDILNINNAFELLKKDFETFKNDIDAYILKISSEDFLDETGGTPSRELFKARYMKLLEDEKGIIDEAARFPEILSEFNKKKIEIDSISVKINSEISKMYGVKLHSYTLPKDINGKNIDVVEITLERYDKTIANPAPDIYKYNIWVTGGVKIDISGGIFLTSLMNKEYETKDDTGVNKFIYEKNKGNYDFGFGSSINISLRNGSWIRPALGIGALFTTGQKFQIMTGLGLIIGKEERIILHGGLTMGAISVISNNYKVDGSTSYSLGGDGAIPTTNKFSFGHFFGVTYNLGKVKKQDTPK